MSGTGFDQLPIVDRVLIRFGGIIQGIGMSQPLARQVVERAIADDPGASPADIRAMVRAWMLIALA